jgi:hypothetical protein
VSRDLVRDVLKHSPAQGMSKFAHVVLASHADEHGKCFPSRDQVAREMGVSLITARRALADLKTLAVVDVALRAGPVPINGDNAGRQDRRPNLYTVRATSTTAHYEPPSEGTTAHNDGSSRRLNVEPLTVTPLTRTRPTATPLPASAKVAAPRRRDELFDALAGACGIEVAELTRSARGALNRARKDLGEVGATPEDVAARADRYRRRWPAMTLTPSALAKHWPELADGGGPLDAIERAYQAAKKAGR